MEDEEKPPRQQGDVWRKPVLVKLSVSATQDRKHKSTFEPGDKNGTGPAPPTS
jgi:hypothetical protein